MGVYIKGFPLPNNCGACPLRLAWCRERIYMVTRPERCPLVPVPEHGDLIDRVAFREEMDKHYPFDRYTQSKHEWEDAAKSAVIIMLATAPTIIPADPAEEGEE